MPVSHQFGNDYLGHSDLGSPLGCERDAGGAAGIGRLDWAGGAASRRLTRVALGRRFCFLADWLLWWLLVCTDSMAAGFPHRRVKRAVSMVTWPPLWMALSSPEAVFLPLEASQQVQPTLERKGLGSMFGWAGSLRIGGLT